MSYEREQPVEQAKPKGQPIAKKPEPQKTPEAKGNSVNQTITLEDLPSKGKLYPPEAKIDFRPYNFLEARTFQQRNFRDLEEVTAMIAKGVFTEGMHKDDILLIDFMYIALMRKLLSQTGTEYEVRFSCANCGEGNSHKFSIADLETTDLEGSWPRVISISGVELSFYPATMRNMREQTIYSKKRKDVNAEIVWLACQVQNMPIPQAYDMIANATYEDIDALEKLDTDLTVGVKSAYVDCHSCSTENEVDLVRWDQVIKPFRG